MTTNAELNETFDKLSATAMKVKRDRDALLAAAKAADDWIKTVTAYEDNVPYVYGRYDSAVDRILIYLKKAIEEAEKP